jgi:DNA mismatch repair protein MutL
VSSNAKPQTIRLLPEHLIDQIKAGEVIERSANVLKELIENALDAGAKQVDVEIRDNGLTLMRVSDDGHGITREQIPLAFGRHATSKINAFEDLYRLSTFGFRGEALPSIASVSRMECVSWTQDELQGGVLRFEGGKQEALHAIEKSGRPQGTVMTIQDLFFNTPVRLKFLQSPTSEKNWLKRFFYSFVLASPQVGFSILWDDEERQFYAPTTDHVARLRQLFSAKAQERLRIHEMVKEWQGLRCRVVTVFSSGARADGPLEHVTVNGRPVLDKAYGRVIQQVLEKAQLHEVPSTLVFLDVPGDQVDVNVHPNKTLVKFHQMGEILSLVTATLREALPKSTPVIESAREFALPTATPVAVDLERDRGESYAGHLQRFSNQEDLGLTTGSLTLFQEAGPYFLWQTPQSAHPVYIDGRALLSFWIKLQGETPAESEPLLVSHPLRDRVFTVESIQHLNQQGFEIDELEKDFYVVREIPHWGRGIPLSLLMPLVLSQSPLPTIHYHEISQGKWEEVWNDCSIEKWRALGVFKEITPSLFGRK